MKIKDAKRGRLLTVIPVTKANASLLSDRTGYEYDSGDMIGWAAVLIDEERQSYIVLMKDGNLWACAYNEDELFTTVDDAFNWLHERL